MPRAHASPHSSDSEDSAPELVTLSSSKKASRTRVDAVQAFEAAQKEKRKKANRERDAALKEARAAKEEERRVRDEKLRAKEKAKSKGKRAEGKGKAKEADSEALDAEKRMERAMREAAEEDGSESNEEEDEEEWSGVQGLDMDAEDAAGASSNHLPEHLFAAAASRPLSSGVVAASEPTPKPRKKKHKKSKAKELIVGSRTVRTLPSPHPDALTASLTLPPTRVKRFLKRTLNLRQSGGGSKQGGAKPGGGANMKAKAWERRPVNVGVMRTAGPAKRFVRGA